VKLLPFDLTPRGVIRDARDRDWGELASHAGDEAIQISHLKREHFGRVADIRWRGLRFLSLRHLHSDSLDVLRAFTGLERLEVWQSEQVTSLTGIEVVPGLRSISLSELGTIQSLAPVAKLEHISELLLMGGVWKDQQLACDFTPLAALSALERLTLTNVRGATDLSPLLSFRQLEHLHLATDRFPVDEIARVAATYDFWRRNRPWVVKPEDSATLCDRCGSRLTFLFLQRKKRTWCETCDRERFGKVLGWFEALIDKYRGLGDSQPQWAVQ
jgi:hypothetical protein